MIKTENKKKTIGQLHTSTFKFILEETSNLSVSCQAGLYTKFMNVFLQLLLFQRNLFLKNSQRMFKQSPTG